LPTSFNNYWSTLNSEDAKHDLTHMWMSANAVYHDSSQQMTAGPSYLSYLVYMPF